MGGSRPGWMQALFAEAYDAGSEAEIDRIIDDWMGRMPVTAGMEDAFDTIVAQGYAPALEDPDAYTLEAAAEGNALNCAGRAFATAALAWEQHGIDTRPVIQYKGTAEDPEGSHLCLLADRKGGCGGRLYGNTGEGDTLEAMEAGPYTYEVLGQDAFHGVYLATEGYEAWHGERKADARAYARRIAALELDSPWLDARVRETSLYAAGEQNADGFVFPPRRSISRP